jgi:hypothetical protein
MRKGLLVAAVGFGLLAGCSGMSYAIENYQGTKPVQYSYSGKTFRIYDKPIDGRIMITPTIGAAMAQGATFGAAATAEMTYEKAAQAYLDSTNRVCTVGDMKLIVQPQWETFYTCDAE